MNLPNAHEACASAAEIMSTIKELDAVALTRDLPEHGLQRGDVGTAVLVHGKGEAFEVEFVRYDGCTVALLTLEQNDVRSLHSGDIPHARELLSFERSQFAALTSQLFSPVPYRPIASLAVPTSAEK